MENKKPKCKLIGEDGNAFFILSAVRKALTKAGQEDKWPACKEKMTSGDYNNLLNVAGEYVEII